MHAGFAMTGTEVRTADVSVNDQDAVEVTSGMDQPLALLWFAALQNLHPLCHNWLQESRTSGS